MSCQIWMYTGDKTLFLTETDPGVTASCPETAATLGCGTRCQTSASEPSSPALSLLSF